MFSSAVDNTSFPALTDWIDSRALYFVTEFSMKLCCRGFHRDCQFTSFISLTVEFFSWIFVSHRSPATHRQAETTKWNTDQQQPDSWITSDLETERFDLSDTPHTNTHRQTSPNSLPLSEVTGRIVYLLKIHLYQFLMISANVIKTHYLYKNSGRIAYFLFVSEYRAKLLGELYSRQRESISETENRKTVCWDSSMAADRPSEALVQASNVDKTISNHATMPLWPVVCWKWEKIMVQFAWTSVVATQNISYHHLFSPWRKRSQCPISPPVTEVHEIWSKIESGMITP